MAVTVTGTEGADTINESYPGRGNEEHVFGLGGDDVIFGIVNDATLEGGAGDDQYLFFNDTWEQTIFIEDEDGGDDEIRVVRDNADPLNHSFVVPENVEDFGGAYVEADSTITGSNAHNFISVRFDGAGLVQGLGGDDEISAITESAVRLEGGDGDDFIYANSAVGPDFIDTLVGGAGDDVFGAEPEDLVVEDLDGGHDLVRTQGTGTFVLAENVEDLFLTYGGSKAIGNDLDNVLSGNGASSHFFDGKAGDDTMYGGSGDDTFLVDSLGDVVRDGGGFDLVRSAVDFRMRAGLENLTLTGEAEAKGVGNGSDNRIAGNAGANNLRGENGEDTLIGGRGDDLMQGGRHHDRFEFGAKFGDDVIAKYAVDGQGADVIAFDTKVFADFEDVMAHATQAGAHVLIDAGDYGSLLLKDVDLGDLSEANFDFFAG